MHLYVFILFILKTPTTPETSTLSLHDALPISRHQRKLDVIRCAKQLWESEVGEIRDRKSTRLNSSHRCISYAVFCLKKKRTTRSSSTFSRVRPFTDTHFDSYFGNDWMNIALPG